MFRFSLRSLLFACLLSLVTVCLAAGPGWWTSRDVIKKDSAGQPVPAQDYAAINQGQLKKLAKEAVAEMESSGLPGGAGTVLDSMVASWNTPGANAQDYAAVNLGQLKTVGKPFYDRLITWGVVSAYPWQGGTANDYALANIGQAKNLFNWNLRADTDSDGMYDSWELQVVHADPNDAITNVSQVSPAGDFDGDGISNLQEFTDGTDLTNAQSNSRVLLSLQVFTRLD